MKHNPLLERQDKSDTKRVLLGAVAVFFLTFCLLIQGRYTSMKHHMALYYAMTALESGSQTSLQQAVPFAWDSLYTFPTGTSKEEMATAMAVDSQKNLSVTRGAELQFYFVHEHEVVCAVVGTAVSLGFSFDWGEDVLEFHQETVFSVEEMGYVSLVAR